MPEQKPASFLKFITHHFLVIAVAAVLTVSFFLVLPLMQAISKPPNDKLIVTEMNVTNIPPPPPPLEEEPKEEEKQEEEPPKLEEDNTPLDLAQLELATSPSFGGPLAGDFAINLKVAGGGDKDVDALFSLADLDQKPRVIYQPSPALTPEVREKAPGTVYVIFVVNPQGRVEDPKVQRSDDPVFERPALAAVKQWKFEPGQRAGKAVRFRMRVPITFPRESGP